MAVEQSTYGESHARLFILRADTAVLQKLTTHGYNTPYDALRVRALTILRPLAFLTLWSGQSAERVDSDSQPPRLQRYG